MSSTIIEELNSDYYAESPATYLRTRIMLLIALRDHAKPVDKGLAIGMSGWGMTAQSHEPLDEDAIDSFAVVESISLKHLAAEALVRAYLAHVNMPACPPLTLASLTNFRDFKRATESILNDPPALDTIRRLFRGLTSKPENVASQDWDDDGEVLSYLLRRAADLILNHSHVYNSTKHGLAVQPRTSAVTIGADDPVGPVIDHSGSSIRYLSKGRRDADGLDPWSEIIQFEFPSINLTLASAFTDALEALHDIAAARFNKQSVQISLRPKSLVDQLQSGPFTGARSGGLLTLSMKRTFAVHPENL